MKIKNIFLLGIVGVCLSYGTANVSASELTKVIGGGSYIIGSERLGVGSCSGVSTVYTDQYTNYQAQWKRGCSNNNLVSEYYMYYSDMIDMGRASSTNGEGTYRTSAWTKNVKGSYSTAVSPTNVWTKSGTNKVNYDYTSK